MEPRWHLYPWGGWRQGEARAQATTLRSGRTLPSKRLWSSQAVLRGCTRTPGPSDQGLVSPPPRPAAARLPGCLVGRRCSPGHWATSRAQRGRLMGMRPGCRQAASGQGKAASRKGPVLGGACGEAPRGAGPAVTALSRGPPPWVLGALAFARSLAGGHAPGGWCGGCPSACGTQPPTDLCTGT